MPVCFLNLKLQEVIFNAEGIQVAQHFTKCWHVQYICMAYNYAFYSTYGSHSSNIGISFDTCGKYSTLH